jgi:1-deoxy-D-xylulose-5-phosphate synthase
MGIGTGLSPFEEAHPDRYFDVGIAEEHAMTFAAGLAGAGMKPYFAVYSTFLQRAYDNLLHDVALQGLPVRLLVDRAALAEGDGPTHHGVFDVSFFSHVPRMTLWAPIAFGSLERMLRDSLSLSSPLAIRYPNAGEDEEAVRAFYPDGNYENRLARADFPEDAPPRRVIVTYGRAVSEALRAKKLLAGEGISVGVILLEGLMPYADTAKRVASLLSPEADVLFLEEGMRSGGAGMLLADALSQMGAPLARYRILALSDFVTGEKGRSMLSTAGISAEDAARAFRE